MLNPASISTTRGARMGAWGAALIAALTLLAACNSPGGSASNANITVAPSTATLSVGETLELAATVTGSVDSVTWSTQPQDVVDLTVSGQGARSAVVTARSVGDVTITASVAGATPATVSITVEADEEAPDELREVAFLAGAPTSVGTGGNLDLAPFFPSTSASMLGVSTSAVRWSSRDPSIATVTQDGVVTGQSVGRVTVSASDGSVVAQLDIDVASFSTALFEAEGEAFLFSHVVAFEDGSAAVISSHNPAMGFLEAGSRAFTLPSVGSGEHLFVAKTGVDGRWEWVTQATSTQNVTPYAATSLPDGGTLVAGRMYGDATLPGLRNGPSTLQADGSAQDAFIAKVSADGSWAWARRLGGAGEEEITGLDVAPDGTILVTGLFNSATLSFDTPLYASDPVLTRFSDPGEFDALNDVFVAGMNQDGDWMWASNAHTTTFFDTPPSIAASPDGGAFVAGFFGGTMQFSKGPAERIESGGFSDLFVAHVDAEGAWTWVARADGYVEESAFVPIAAHPDGGAVLASISVLDEMRFTSPGRLQGPTFEASGDYDPFVARISANGTWLWVTGMHGTGYEELLDVTVLQDGSILTAGYVDTSVQLLGPGGRTVSVDGGASALAATLTPDGAWTSVLTLDGDADDYVTGVAALPGGGAFVAGDFTSTRVELRDGGGGGGRIALPRSGVTGGFIGKVTPEGTWSQGTR